YETTTTKTKVAVKATTKKAVIKQQSTKVSSQQSAYAYLASLKPKRSCSSGSCPFWEKHGRSFAALRCYQKRYQECTCLHRMCFSSCMFDRQTCNTEMVACLKQICSECMPPSATAVCTVYDSMAERVAEALSMFACYPCCPQAMMNNSLTEDIIASSTASTVPPNGYSSQPGEGYSK
ncbi:unnamed protein product, partial [Didymodactylos carnosus]